MLHRIAVEQRKQGNLLTLGLKLGGNGVRYKPAKRPAEQIVRTARLNLPNYSHIILGHFMDRAGAHRPLREITSLQTIDWMFRRDMPDELGIRPAESAGVMNAEQR